MRQAVGAITARRRSPADRISPAAYLPTSRPHEARAAYGTAPDARRFATVLTAVAPSATGASAGFTYLVKLLGDVSGFSPSRVDTLLGAFGVACPAGVAITGALIDRFPHAVLATAVATRAAGMLGLYAAGTHPVAAVLFLVLVGGALGPVFMATQNEMLHCAPGRTDTALAANSAAYNIGIAAGAALGGLLLPLAGVRPRSSPAGS
ncbi:MFS transporter [Streptomyces minutiscleroticus]|uniref:MFS transporter n=1 Tax=Streptomyces minutiscleroticus TaxID=68238 RepID=UPI0033188D6A